MKKKNEILKCRCPGCGSHNLFAIDFDQFCLDCDWENSQLLVGGGYMDHLQIAAQKTFSKSRTTSPKSKTTKNIQT